MKKQLKNKKVFFRLFTAGVIFIMIIMNTSSWAQMTARGLGMGGAFTAVARGVHSADWNPANLGLSDNPKFSMSIISVEAGVWNNSFTPAMYNKYNGKYLTPQDIEDILNSIPDNGFSSNFETNLRILSFSAGRFALTIGVTGGGYINFAKSLFEIPLSGTEINKTYEISDTEGKSLGIGLVGFSYGHPISVDFADEFSVGGSVKLFYGGGYGNTDKTEFVINSRPYGLDLDGLYEVTYAYNGGIGWGMDIGGAAIFNEKWNVSLSISNLFSNLPFKNDVQTEKGTFQADSLSVISDFDEDFSDTSWTVEGAALSAHLPPVLKIGCSYREGNVIISADYWQSFFKGPFSSTTPRFSVGTEWRGVSWLPLRMGVIIGGNIGFGTSYGIGIRPGGFVLDLALMNHGFVSPNNSEGVIIALDIGIDLYKND